MNSSQSHKLGKERGYLLSEEVEQVLPAELHSTEEMTILLSTFERVGIHPLRGPCGGEGRSCRRRSHRIPSPVGGMERQNPRCRRGRTRPYTGDGRQKNNDPVRLYLREMGSVPLLKRQDEVAIAKRMERGHLMVLKSISRSPIVLKELIAVGEELRNGTLSIKKIIQFDQEELTEEELRIRRARCFESLGRFNSSMLWHSRRRPSSSESRSRKSGVYLRHRNGLARTRVEMSLLVRSIEFHALEKKRLIGKIRSTVERVQSLSAKRSN